MRYLIVCATMAVVAMVCSNSEAANRRVRMAQTPAGNGYVVPQGSSDGPFTRLMELERRKNAALRQMFFGR